MKARDFLKIKPEDQEKINLSKEQTNLLKELAKSSKRHFWLIMLSFAVSLVLAILEIHNLFLIHNK